MKIIIENVNCIIYPKLVIKVLNLTINQREHLQENLQEDSLDILEQNETKKINRQIDEIQKILDEFYIRITDLEHNLK